MVPRPDHVTVKNLGAQSGNVPLDNGERVYVAPGDVIAQKYRVDRILGVGGVGFVLAAKHVDLDGYFALKFLKKRFLRDASIVERFTREAKAACRIKSEYVARVYDVGSHAGAPFIVMEHLVGRDLAALLAERGAFSIGDATEYGIQACAALAVAHASGIIHRDIKPENLFLVDHEGLPTVKLLDFGISKLSLAADRPTADWPAEGEALTGRQICGTPYYMSPEQIRSTASVDARTDVWSLGMVLYELLSGTPAFVADAVADICSAILEKEATPLSEVRHDIPQGVADVIARCLRKDPNDRYPSVAELAVALLPFAPPRALAIAEGSAWIRRAAIQTVGAVPLDGARPSAGSVSIVTGPRSAPSSPRSAVTPAAAPAPLGPAVPAPRTTRRSSASKIAAALVAATLLAGGGAWVMRKPTTLPELPPVGKAQSPGADTPASAQSHPTRTADVDDLAASSSLTATPPPLRPSAAPAQAPHSPTPLRRAPAVYPIRGPATTKASTAATTTTPTETSSTPAAAPPRPDLGY
jgi:serine/threonine-protein kinase